MKKSAPSKISKTPEKSVNLPKLQLSKINPEIKESPLKIPHKLKKKVKPIIKLTKRKNRII